MKKGTIISRKALHAFLGMLVGLFVLTQAVVADQISHDSADKTEQSDSDDTENQQITESIAIASSSFQLSLDYQSYLLEEVLFKNEVEEGQSIIRDVLFSSHSALEVILRRIISPNAP